MVWGLYQFSPPLPLPPPPACRRLRQLPWATVQCDAEGAIASANTMFRRRQGQRAGRALGGRAGAKLHALTGQPPHFDPLPVSGPIAIARMLAPIVCSSVHCWGRGRCC